MRKALILGTNAGQADIITFLKDTGWVVHTCGFKKIGPGVELAHQFHLVNTIDIDAVEQLAKDINPDIVYSVSSDVNMRSATLVSERLGLPFILDSKTVDLFHFKDKLRHFLNTRKISPVGYKRVQSIEEAKEWDIFPCVVKPADSQGQRGVELVYSDEYFHQIIDTAIENSASETAILEEYLDGVEVSTNIIVQNSKVLVNEFTERLVHGTDYFGLPKGHSIPVRNVPQAQIDEASKMVEALIHALQLVNAVLYIQLIITKKGPRIVEVAPRLDGCHIWRLLRTAKDYDLRDYAIKCLLGQPIRHERNDNPENYTLVFHQLNTDEVFSTKHMQLPKGTLFNEYRYSDGEAIVPINGSLEVVGYYIYKG